MICAICKREFAKSNNLANHITRTHKIPIQQYYDTHIKGNCRCVVCGNPTTFVNLSVGYKKHCSTKCSANDSAVKTKINICFLMIIALTKNWISSGVIFEIGIAFKNFSKKFGKMWKKERMKS